MKGDRIVEIISPDGNIRLILEGIERFLSFMTSESYKMQD
ncbi:hypothetical protein J5U23_01665 [Saccharolobus shibatae B12]|uniref:Uncharacterized protein n=1 Tax=Saccharolobus shibatae (strain ATCC 51178 / DSM 5389 / JCM 8931 / NBRC 15437 / B12) TaxID=523848 RepID=A0A8F5BP90_SACSH|nr:hypothetical protein J5U23_01665 [Saccharolobus shibatae B12]